MDLRQLRYLVALADDPHFTRAAARAHVAQPALSRQISRLEAELGVRLVDRTTRHVALSAAGLRLAARARQILAAVEDAELEARELSGAITGRLTIGVTSTPGPLDVADTLAAFHDRQPTVDLAVREALSTVLTDQLRSSEVDLALITDVGAARRQRIEIRSLATEPLVVCLPPEHRLAGRRRVRVTELRDERFIAFQPGATIRQRFEDAAARAGFAPHVVFESGEALRARALVARGLGIAILPLSDARSLGPVVATASLDDPELVHEVFVAWRPDRRQSLAAQAFLELVLGQRSADAEAVRS